MASPFTIAGDDLAKFQHQCQEIVDALIVAQVPADKSLSIFCSSHFYK